LSALLWTRFIIGPAVGGLLGNINFRFPFWRPRAQPDNASTASFVLPSLCARTSRKSACTWPIPLAPSSSSPRIPNSPARRSSLSTTSPPMAHVRLGHLLRLPLLLEPRRVGTSSPSLESAPHRLRLLVGPFVKRFGEVQPHLRFAFRNHSFICFACPRVIVLATIPFIALWGIAAPAFSADVPARGSFFT